ncbi:hypothetical protein BS78_05G289900 [Paspalum vaginatum]|nr:hypothetical protein BS78_05G289900 [Paspalum vaginatum]
MYTGGDDIVDKQQTWIGGPPQLRYKYKQQEEGSRRRRELEAAAAAAGAATTTAASSGRGRRLLRRSVSMSVVGGRLASAAREHKARLYIMRRCVSMLVRSSWGNGKDR